MSPALLPLSYPELLTIFRGELHNQVHVHMMICIDHYSMIHLDTAKIKEHFLSENPELGNVYVHCKPHRGSAFDPNEVLRNYIFKNAAPKETVRSDPVQPVRVDEGKLGTKRGRVTETSRDDRLQPSTHRRRVKARR